MLKIKDNVDLKELEKFGFKEFDGKDDKNGGSHIDGYEIEGNIETNQYAYLLVSRYNREICGQALTVLYDLIKADLVEKV